MFKKMSLSFSFYRLNYEKSDSSDEVPGYMHSSPVMKLNKFL